MLKVKVFLPVALVFFVGALAIHGVSALHRQVVTSLVGLTKRGFDGDYLRELARPSRRRRARRTACASAR